MLDILQYIGDFLSSIVGTIQSLFSFLLNTIQGLLTFIMNLPKFITYITSAIGFLPSFLAFFATITISIAVIYVILGRGGKE